MVLASVGERNPGSRCHIEFLCRDNEKQFPPPNPPLDAVSAGRESMLWLPGVGASRGEHGGALGAVGAAEEAVHISSEKNSVNTVVRTPQFFNQPSLP
jgi:hypothetical protein